MSSRRQAKLITIYWIPGFSFSSPSGLNAIHAFNMRFHGSQKRIAIILLPIFDKLQFLVSICQKGFIGYHILLLELISFLKLQPQKHRQRQNINYVMRIQRLYKLQYHRRFLILFSILYPLFNKIQRNFNETVCERTRFAKIYTTHLLFTVEGILFSGTILI